VPTFYRVIKRNPPSLDDFTSNQALGRVLRDPAPERQRLWSGISVNATESQATSAQHVQARSWWPTDRQPP